MFYDEDDFDTELEEVEFEDEFPDEDEDITVFDDKTGRTEPMSQAAFVIDPWPKTAFVLILIGFGLVLLTPVPIWSVHVYTLVLNYGLILFSAIVIVQSLKIWVVGEGNRLKWGAIINLILVFAAVVLGTLDTASWIFFGVSVIPGFESSLLLLCLMLVIISLYSSFILQRTFNAEETE